MVERIKKAKYLKNKLYSQHCLTDKH